MLFIRQISILLLFTFCWSVHTKDIEYQTLKQPTQQSNSVHQFVQAVRNGAVVVCPDGRHCDDTQSCCPLVNNGTAYGCCSETNGVCCSPHGRDTCCAQNGICCPTQGCCGSGSKCCADGGCCQNIASQECCGQICCNTAVTRCCGGRACCAGPCCSDGSCCAAGQTCCGDFCCSATNSVCCSNVNVPGCCSSANSVCCNNGICCPTGTRCCGTNQCCQLDLLNDVILPEWTYKAMNTKQVKRN